MAITIQEVENTKDLKKFIRFYTNLYKNNTSVGLPLEFDEISTLTKGKNPAHEICDVAYWLALDGQKIVGRIAAIINTVELKKEENPIGRFGFFDFIDDESVSKILMETAEKWLKERNINRIHGPLGFTDMDRQGLLIKGFDRLSTMATLYNYEYYIKHFEALGFEKSTDWVEYTFDFLKDVPRKIETISKFVQRKYKLRSLKIKKKSELKKHIPRMFDLINETYKDLYGYTSLSKEQIEYYAKNYFGFVNKNLISIIVNEQDELVGIGVTMPSFTKALQKAKGKLLPFGWYHMLKALKKNDVLDLYLVAVSKEYQDKGATVIMIEELYKAAQNFGIKYCETNIELEDNHKVQSLWKYFDAEQHKRRRCYIKNI